MLINKYITGKIGIYNKRRLYDNEHNEDLRHFFYLAENEMIHLNDECFPTDEISTFKWDISWGKITK